MGCGGYGSGESIQLGGTMLGQGTRPRMTAQ